MNALRCPLQDKLFYKALTERNSDEPVVEKPFCFSIFKGISVSRVGICMLKGHTEINEESVMCRKGEFNQLVKPHLVALTFSRGTD